MPATAEAQHPLQKKVRNPMHTPGSDNAEFRLDDDERLISRLIDGEADDADMEHFPARALARPDLLRHLLAAQRDAARLSLACEEITGTAGITALRAPARGRVNWPAWSGWAAAVIACAVLAAPRLSPPATPGTEPRSAALTETSAADEADQSPDHLLSRYLMASHVLGDLEPMLQTTTELPDGRLAVVYLRRIEEVAILDLARLDPERLPRVSDDGLLSADPQMLMR